MSDATGLMAEEGMLNIAPTISGTLTRAVADATISSCAISYHTQWVAMHPGTGVDPAAIAGAFQAAFENLQYMMD